MVEFDDYPDLLDLKQAAELLGVHPRTVRRMIKQGHLPAYRLAGGQQLRIKKSDLLEAALEPVEPEGQRDSEVTQIQAAIREELIRVARRGRTISYRSLAQRLGLTWNGYVRLQFLPRMLGPISTSEHVEGRPLLSAVVVRKIEGDPGDGFYTMAQERGVYRPVEDTEEERLEFFVWELRRVHEYWQGWEETADD